jgi:DNA (cytosine-5)-methyltransferase 1
VARSSGTESYREKRGKLLSVALQSRGIISLCTGYGGLDLGLRLAGVEARASVYVERDIKAARLLVTRFEAGKLDPADIWSDLKTFDASAYRGSAYLTAGYPCQPFSAAGKKLGKKDPRHLWPYVAAAIWDAKPRRVFLENVDAHLRLGFREVATELRAMGYRVAAGLFSSEETGNTHRRLRLFCLAELEHSDASRNGTRSGNVRDAKAANGGGNPGEFAKQCLNWPSVTVGDSRSSARHTTTTGIMHPGTTLTDAARMWPSARAEDAESCGNHPGAVDSLTGAVAALARTRPKARDDRRSTQPESITGKRTSDHYRGTGRMFPPGPEDFESWIRVIERNPEVKPAVCGVAYGSSSRVDRLRLLGNGVDPLVAAHAHRTLEYALALAE